MSQQCWQIIATVPRAQAEAAEMLLLDIGGEDNPPSIAAFAPEDDASLYVVEAYYMAEPDLIAARAAIETALGDDLLGLRAGVMPDRDWVAESQSMLPPITAGRFHIYGGHAKDSLKPGKIGLLIEAAQAFGTGRHETTLGCMLALDWLSKRQRFTHALDLGCGSGVLALGIAKYWRVPVVANDIDPVSVKVARENVRVNHVPLLATHRPQGGRYGVNALTATGFQDPRIRAAAPYPLIMANILAEPLKRLAYDMRRATARGGNVVLAGLLANQEPGVLAAYRAQGFRLEKRIRIGQWPTLILKV